jgi:hypothetical protein
MKHLRLACALGIALFGATAMAEAAAKPAWVPPSNPPETLTCGPQSPSFLAAFCSLLSCAVFQELDNSCIFARITGV